MIGYYLSSGSRNRAWLKWKYRPQHPWLVLASPLESPQRPWPAQDPWVCSPPSTAQARPPHPPALLLQSDMGTPLCLPHRQVDCQESSLISALFLKIIRFHWVMNYLYSVNIPKKLLATRDVQNRKYDHTKINQPSCLIHCSHLTLSSDDPVTLSFVTSKMMFSWQITLLTDARLCQAPSHSPLAVWKKLLGWIQVCEFKFADLLISLVCR